MNSTPQQYIVSALKNQQTELPLIRGGGETRNISVDDYSKFSTLPRNFKPVLQTVNPEKDLSKSLSTGRGQQKRPAVFPGLFTPPGLTNSAKTIGGRRKPAKSAVSTALFTAPEPESPVLFSRRSKETVDKIMEGMRLHLVNGYLDEELSLDKKYESQTDLIEKIGGIFATLGSGNTKPEKLKELEKVVAEAMDIGDDMLRTMAGLFKRTGEQVNSLAENIKSLDIEELEILQTLLEKTTKKNKFLKKENYSLTGAKKILEENNKILKKKTEELEKDNRDLEEQYENQLEELSQNNKKIRMLEDQNFEVQRQKLSCEENIRQAKKKVKKMRKNINRYLQ